MELRCDHKIPVHLRLSLSDNHNDSETLADHVAV